MATGRGRSVRIESLGEFVALARHLNFSRAASELNLSQPALSKRIAALEADLGFELFKRTRPLQLTPSGESFLFTAQRVVQAFDEGVTVAHGLNHRLGPVRLLWFEGAHYADVLAEHDIPEFEIAPMNGTESIFSTLERGLADVVSAADLTLSPDLLERARQAGIARIPTGTMPIYLVVSKNGSLGSRDSLMRSDLAGRESIIISGAVFNEWGDMLTNFLGADLGIHTILRPLPGNYANLRKLELGESSLLLHEDAVFPFLSSRKDVVIFDHLDGKPLELPACALYKADNPNAHVHEFAERLRTYFA